MIPTTRPVIGRDLEEIKQLLGLSAGDTCFLLGLSITKWTSLVRTSPDEPVKDPTLALLVRFLDRYPEMSIMPTYPTATEMFDMFKALVPNMDQRRFSVLFGAERAACSRWLRTGGARISPDLARLMLYLRNQLAALPEEERLEALREWADVVQIEGQARGVSNVFRVGRWSANNQEHAANDSPPGPNEFLLARPPKKRSSKKKIEGEKVVRKKAPAKKVAAKKTAAKKKAAAKKAAAKKTPEST